VTPWEAIASIGAAVAGLASTVAALFRRSPAADPVDEPPPQPKAPAFDAIEEAEERRLDELRAGESVPPSVVPVRAVTPSEVDAAEDAGALSGDEAVPTRRMPGGR